MDKFTMDMIVIAVFAFLFVAMGVAIFIGIRHDAKCPHLLPEIKAQPSNDESDHWGIF